MIDLDWLRNRQNIERNRIYKRIGQPSHCRITEAPMLGQALELRIFQWLRFDLDRPKIRERHHANGGTLGNPFGVSYPSPYPPWNPPTVPVQSSFLGKAHKVPAGAEGHVLGALTRSQIKGLKDLSRFVKYPSFHSPKHGHFEAKGKGDDKIPQDRKYLQVLNFKSWQQMFHCQPRPSRSIWTTACQGTVYWPACRNSFETDNPVKLGRGDNLMFFPLVRTLQLSHINTSSYWVPSLWPGQRTLA